MKDDGDRPLGGQAHSIRQDYGESLGIFAFVELSLTCVIGVSDVGDPGHVMDDVNATDQDPGRMAEEAMPADFHKVIKCDLSQLPRCTDPPGVKVMVAGANKDGTTFLSEPDVICADFPASETGQLDQAAAMRWYWH